MFIVDSIIAIAAVCLFMAFMAFMYYIFEWTKFIVATQVDEFKRRKVERKNEQSFEM